MENDSIRASGSDTLVDIWIDGKIRAIRVLPEAIGAMVGYERMSEMSDSARCEFVRAQLSLVMSAARDALRADPTASELIIAGGQLQAAGGTPGGDRRKVDRRKTERRQKITPASELPHPDRRRGDRRASDRRSKSRKPPAR